MKVQKEHSTPILQIIKNEKIELLRKNLKNNLTKYITILNEKDNEARGKKINKKKINFQKRKYLSDNEEKLDQKNVSPLLLKFRNFYSLLYKINHKNKTLGFGNNKNDKKRGNDGNNDNNNFELKCMSINRIHLPLNCRDINWNKNNKNRFQQNEDNYNKMKYLKTTSSLKSINNSFFYSSRKQLHNNNSYNKNHNNINEQSKLKSNIFSKNKIKKSQTFQYEKTIINKKNEYNELNLPSIIRKQEMYGINLNDYQKIIPLNKRHLIKQINNNNSILSYSNTNNIEMNSQFFVDNQGYINNILEEEDELIKKRNSIFLNLNNDINTTAYLNHNNLYNKELKIKNKVNIIYPLKKNSEINYIYDLPPVNYYKDDYYYYNIFPSNCGWLIKNCFKHRLNLNGKNVIVIIQIYIILNGKKQ